MGAASRSTDALYFRPLRNRYREAFGLDPAAFDEVVVVDGAGHVRLRRLDVEPPERAPWVTPVLHQRVERATVDLDLADRAGLEVEPHAPAPGGTDEIDRRPSLVGRLQLGGCEIGRGRDAPGERRDEVLRGQWQAQGLLDRLGVGRADLCFVLERVVDRELPLVNGDDAQRRAER